MSAALIGVDCAVDPRKTGIARGRIEEEKVIVTDVIAGLRTTEALDRALLAWLAPGCWLALDAPLGWPAALGDALAGHRAGEALAPAASALFARHTDRYA